MKKESIVVLMVLGVVLFSGCMNDNAGATEKACINSGGAVRKSMCCKTAADFPNLCLIGACGCSPDNSHEVEICDCGENKCFDGSACVEKKQPEGPQCATESGESMSLSEAKKIALAGECGNRLKDTHVCNENTGTWWIDLDITKEGCNPACVINVATKKAEINWRCTGVIPKPQEKYCVKTGSGEQLGLTEAEEIASDSECAHKPVCCEIYGLGANMEKVDVQYKWLAPDDCSVPEGFTGGGKKVVGDSHCTTGPLMDDEYMCNGIAGTWSIDLDIEKEGCSPVCIVDVSTKEAEINWRCTEEPPEPEEEYCVDLSSGRKLGLKEAEEIALHGECGNRLKDTHVCNENTGTWWIDLDITKEGCNPACVINVVTKKADINWRCTGVLPDPEKYCSKSGSTRRLSLTEAEEMAMDSECVWDLVCCKMYELNDRMRKVHVHYEWSRPRDCRTSEGFSGERREEVSDRHCGSGPLMDEYWCHTSTGSWWINLDIEREDCNPVCVVDVSSGRAELDWRCKPEEKYCVDSYSGRKLGLKEAEEIASDSECVHKPVCCEVYGLSEHRKKVDVYYVWSSHDDCSVPEGFVGGGKKVVGDSHCGSGPLTDEYRCHTHPGSWWFNLDIEKEDCNPVCVVDVATKEAEINWRCKPKEEYCVDSYSGRKLGLKEAEEIALDSECVHKPVCCELYGLNERMKKVDVHYLWLSHDDCSVPEGFTGGGKKVVGDRHCGDGPLTDEHECNVNTGTWWFNLDITKEGCNPACVVDVSTKEAEINWRCR